MDNDLMARRLRPSSQPTPSHGQSPAQPPAPWDVPLADEGPFAPAQSAEPEQDPPFAPPDPQARADVPWDRPAPESWPWADPLGDAAPSDRPASDDSLDPDDAMAPVVAEVNAPARVWHEWMSSGGANGDGGNGTGYATASTPEPMTVAAHSDQPRGGDEPRPNALGESLDRQTASPGAASPGGSGPPLPEWPAEDDLTPPSSSRGTVMPEDSLPTTPADSAPSAEPSGVQPVAPAPSLTPVVRSAQILPSPPGSPQNMVLRIELAIVDESRVNPADAAERFGPDADVRAPEYNPRTDEGRAPEPEYIWDVPAADVQPQLAPPPSTWLSPAQPTPPNNQPAPWSPPPQPEPQTPSPVAPAPTWALTEPTPSDTPEPPQYSPPSAPRYQQPPAPRSAWSPSPSPDPLSGLPAALSTAVEPAGRGFTSNQPEVATAADHDAEPMGKSSPLLTAGLTVGFAILVVVLVLVFFQLMTSLLR